MFQLYAIAACSSHALALGTAEGQHAAAVVQRDSIGAGADGAQHQPLERRSPSPALFGSRRGGRTRTKAAPAAPKEEFFDANDSFPRHNARLAALQQANPQQADPTTGRPGGGTVAAQEDQFFDANDRTARQQARARLAQLQRANPQRADPQRPTLSRSGQIQKRPRRPRGRGLGLSQAV